LDQSIREGIQELRFGGEPGDEQVTDDDSKKVTSLTDSVYGQRNQQKPASWNAQHSNKGEFRKGSISKDGISNLKQVYHSNLQNSDNAFQHYIAKVKLDRLNTNEFLTTNSNNTNNSSSDNRYATQSQPAAYDASFYGESVATSDL
jgi:hypothetical protein